MAILEKGRICIQRTGRRAGRKVTIIEVKDNFAIVEGEHVKKKKVNIRHLFPLNEIK